MVFNLHDTPLVYISWEERERLLDAARRGVCQSLAIDYREGITV